MSPLGFEVVCRRCGQPAEAHLLRCPLEDGLPLDYIAGFFDGEGAASIKVTKTKKSWCGVSFTPRLGFYQKTPEILDKIAKELGLVNYHLAHRLTGSKGSYGEVHRLEFSRFDDVLRIAKMLQPLCQVKKQHLRIIVDATELLLKEGYPQRRAYASPIPKEAILRLIDYTKALRRLNGEHSKHYVDLEELRKRLEEDSILPIIASINRRNLKDKLIRRLTPFEKIQRLRNLRQTLKSYANT